MASMVNFFMIVNLVHNPIMHLAHLKSQLISAKKKKKLRELLLNYIIY